MRGTEKKVSSAGKGGPSEKIPLSAVSNVHILFKAQKVHDSITNLTLRRSMPLLCLQCMNQHT